MKSLLIICASFISLNFLQIQASEAKERNELSAESNSATETSTVDFRNQKETDEACLRVSLYLARSGDPIDLKTFKAIGYSNEQVNKIWRGMQPDLKEKLIKTYKIIEWHEAPPAPFPKLIQ